MALRDFGTDEALEKYEREKGTTEKSGEGWTADRTEFEAVRKEKKLKKPGAVSRFFNQFGVGKYWERMNDYFEQEEKMEKEEAEKAAAKETVSDVRAAAEEEVGALKEAGAEVPGEVEASASRAGAEEETAAPVIEEAKVEEAAIEKEAEAAKADLDKEVEDVEIVEKISLEDELREKYKGTSVNAIDARIKSLGLSIAREGDSDARELLEAERDILVKIKKEKMPAKAREKKLEVKLPAWDEEENLEDLPPVEEFEIAAKEHEEQAVPSPEKVKAVEVLEEEVVETPPEWENIKPVTSEELKRKVEAGRWKPKMLSPEFQSREPEIFSAMEGAFFAKGEKSARARLEHMVDSLEKVGQAYVAQKAAKEMSPQDEKILRKWVAETKGAIAVLQKQTPEEMKPVKAVELKKNKKIKKAA